MKMNRRALELALLQIEQYDTARYLARRKSVDPDIVARMRMTPRLWLTKILSPILGVAGANIVLSVGVAMSELLIYQWVARRIRQLKQRGLAVVAIAGSYGKTSVKQYSYELLRHKYRVVATPESFNTIFGIAKCLRWEVDAQTELFIVEVGAYRQGDITRLLTMVQPDLGVLTGMARQHLERFGSWENIQKAKSEIGLYMKRMSGKLIANASDITVKENVEKMGVIPVWYRGSTRREVNFAGATCVAQWAGMTSAEIKAQRVREPQSRFEKTTERYGMAVIDDSFSSNEVGFREALVYLGKQRKYTRILVTPGLVELGAETAHVHESLGREIVNKADLVILVGESERTQGLERGIAGKVRLIKIAKTLEFMHVVKDLKLKKKPLVLLENDLTENY